MNVKSKGSRGLAITSLILGVIALGPAVYPFRRLPERLSEGRDPYVVYRFGQIAPRFWIESWMFSVPACVKAVIVLRRNKVEGSDKTTKNKDLKLMECFPLEEFAIHASSDAKYL
jgi:hypothetical protein